jgi:hypothetical protein
VAATPAERSESRGSGRVGCSVSGSHDGFEDRIQFLIDFVIPKSQDLVAGPLQFRITLPIPCSMLVKCVLSTIDLHHETRTPTFEVDDVGEKRRLPAEMKAESPEFAKANP